MQKKTKAFLEESKAIKPCRENGFCQKLDVVEAMIGLLLNPSLVILISEKQRTRHKRNIKATAQSRGQLHAVHMSDQYITCVLEGRVFSHVK